MSLGDVAFLSMLREALVVNEGIAPGERIESGPHKGKLQYVEMLTGGRGRINVGNEQGIFYFW